MSYTITLFTVSYSIPDNKQKYKIQTYDLFGLEYSNKRYKAYFTVHWKI